MKKYLLLAIFSAFAAVQSSAQVVHIELDLKNHANNGGNVTGCVLEPPSPTYKMYIHSGVCSATTAGVPDPADCQNPSFVWEHVVGDWGLDNGYGLMTDMGDSVWAIDIDVATYYSDPGTISQGGQSGSGASTPMALGSTAYSMGFVFRNEDGTIGGITGGCTDFFIFNLHQGNTNVDVGLPGNTLPDTTFRVENTPVGVKDIVSASFKTVYPNPFTDEVKITYEAPIQSDNIEFTIYNALGQKVRHLYQGAINSGVSTLVWDGLTDAGSETKTGVYYLMISDGTRSVTEIIIKQ